MPIHSTPKAKAVLGRVKSEHQTKEFKNSLFGQDSFVLSEDLYRELSYTELKFSSYEFVPFALAGGCEDLYDNLFAALMTSPTHQGIVKKKLNWLIGDGFIPLPKNQRFATNDVMPTDLQLNELSDWLDLQNSEGENIDDVYKKAAYDFTVFGNAYIEFSRTSVGSQKVFTQRVVPFGQGRVGRLKDQEIEPTVLGISNYWVEGWTTNPPDLRTVAIYPKWSVDADGVERSIYHIKNYTPSFLYYGCPDYIAGLIAAKNDYSIGRYNNSRLNSGFTPSCFATVFGDFTPEEGKELVENIEKKFTGLGNNSRIFTTILANKEDAPQYQILDDKSEGAFMELSHLSSQSLVSAHRFTMSLAGFATAGSLGTNQQIRAEFEFVFGDVIKPVQNELMRWVNKSISLCEEWTGANFNTTLAVKNLSPISFINDIPPSQVLTMDEQRALLGYAPLTSTTPENGK